MVLSGGFGVILGGSWTRADFGIDVERRGLGLSVIFYQECPDFLSTFLRF